MKVSPRWYWPSCSFLLYMRVHLIHGLPFRRRGQTCPARQATLGFVWLSGLFCAEVSKKKQKESENAGGVERVYVSLCVCVLSYHKVSAPVCIGAWCECDGTLLCLSPSPLVLISQVDEQISSSPNPSPWIPAHASGMHTDWHVHAASYVNIHKAVSTGICGKLEKKKNALAQKSVEIRRGKGSNTHRRIRWLSAGYVS